MSTHAVARAAEKTSSSAHVTPMQMRAAATEIRYGNRLLKRAPWPKLADLLEKDADSYEKLCGYATLHFLLNEFTEEAAGLVALALVDHVPGRQAQAACIAASLKRIAS
jgi:hypothetical protein